MSWTGAIGSVGNGRPFQARLLALLVAGTLVLCHGVYGASHQLHQAPGPASLHAAAHPLSDGSQGGHGGTHENGGQHPGGEAHPGKAAYAAALAFVLLGAVVAGLLVGARSWVGAAAAPISRRRPLSPVLALPRGSPASVLQVFRL